MPLIRWHFSAIVLMLLLVEDSSQKGRGSQLRGPLIALRKNNTEREFSVKHVINSKQKCKEMT